MLEDKLQILVMKISNNKKKSAICQRWKVVGSSTYGIGNDSVVLESM